jgi:hypothetical protein
VDCRLPNCSPRRNIGTPLKRFPAHREEEDIWLKTSNLLLCVPKDILSESGSCDDYKKS